MRGLKRDYIVPATGACVSHLLQMRGLKHRWLNQQEEQHRRIFYRCVDWNGKESVTAALAIVASFTDAWIETRSKRIYRIIHKVASFTDAWIETVMSRLKDAGLSRIFYRCVDWNNCLRDRINYNISRIFYRCVDWN